MSSYTMYDRMFLEMSFGEGLNLLGKVCVTYFFLAWTFLFGCCLAMPEIVITDELCVSPHLGLYLELCYCFGNICSVTD